MEDIQVNVDDDYLSSNLKSVYEYQKTKVPTTLMDALIDCMHLAGKQIAYA